MNNRISHSDAIVRIKTSLDELERLEVNIWTSQFSAWQTDAELILRSLFGDNHPLTVKFTNVTNIFAIRVMNYDDHVLSSSNWHSKNDFQHVFHEYRNQIKGILEAAVRHLELMASQVRSNGTEVSVDRATAEEMARENGREPSDARDVFVVHGRDLAAARSLIDFLSAIDLHPIEWSEAVAGTGHPTPYVGEILDIAFDQAAAVVVLITPDDEGRLLPDFQQSSDPDHEKSFTPQARMNVIFEAGMAMGRDAKRTVLVQLGTVRPFSDIAGRHILRLDDSVSKRQQLAQRLQLAGCHVNIGGDRWHGVGDFGAPPS